MPFLFYRYCVLPSVFATLWVHIVHCLRIRSCYFFICLLVCLPIDVSLFLPSWCFPLLLGLFLGSYRILHFFAPPLCHLVPSGSPSCWHTYVTLSPAGLRPVDIPSTSCHALNTTKPVSSHNFWTLSNSLLLPNSFSLNCILSIWVVMTNFTRAAKVFPTTPLWMTSS